MSMFAAALPQAQPQHLYCRINLPHGPSMNPPLQRVVIAGASGLTGGKLLSLLLQDPQISEVHALLRSPLAIEHPRLIQHIIDFSNLEQHRELIRGDAVFCCLGTTIRQAGSQAHFKAVDYFYPLTLAMLAKLNGVPRFIGISSLGADANSGNFYLQVKGQLEKALMALQFTQLTLLRPSLLLGERKQLRPAEWLGIQVGKLASPLMCGPLRRYRPISVESVAWNMLDAAHNAGAAIEIRESEQQQQRFAAAC